MIRMSRLTDYGIVLMARMARDPKGVHTAAEVAEAVRLKPPTVAKLLRLLAREGLLESHRGVKGGYSLVRPPEKITIASIITAIEGPIAITSCATHSSERCEHETLCSVRSHWQHIDHAIRTALEEITLDRMTRPAIELFRGSPREASHRRGFPVASA